MNTGTMTKRTNKSQNGNDLKALERNRNYKSSGIAFY